MAVGCQQYRDWRYQETTEVAEQFFRAAARGDSALVEQITVGHRPAEWVETARRVDPELITAAAYGLIPIGGSLGKRDGIVRYSLQGAGLQEKVIVYFARDGSDWRITQIDLPDRH
jgi:hypothetical protein